jgi:general secretion pathway protein D
MTLFRSHSSTGERRAIVLALAASIAGGPIARSAEPPAAVRAATAEAQARIARTEAAQPTIRLNFVATAWPKVLQQVADDAGLQLILVDAPKDRFSRTDWKKYTRDDALHILERELEPLGYKLIVKDQYLTVLSIERMRTEYQRPQVVRPNEPRQDVRRVGYDEGATDSGGVVRTGGQPVASSGPAAPLPQPSRFTPQRRPAVEISRDIYAAFETRSTVADRGPHGLPSFTVWKDHPPTADAPAKRTELFTLELDTTLNAIVVTADATMSKGVVDLVRRLDTIPRTEGETTRLVAGDDNLPAIGRQLQPQLGRLKAGGALPGRQIAWQAGAQDPNATAGQPPAEGAPQPGLPNAQAVVPTVPGGPIGNLRGDVTIQSLNDLNLLIIQGNEADVAQVLAVINTIERVAQGTQPEIRLHTLQHIGSEAVAELLTDLYERLTEQTEATGRSPPTINVVPVVQPNAILILAPTNAMQSIIDLVIQLDQPTDPAAEVEVIRLKNAIASQVVELLEQFYEDRGGLATRVRVIADVRTNSLILQARPRELEEVRLLVNKVDRDSSPAVIRGKIIPLTHASATELAEFLSTTLQSIVNPPQTTGGQGAVGGAGQAPQELRDTKSVVLEFLRNDGEVKRLVKSGLLIDVRVNGDPRTNSLIVTAPRDSIPLLEELIRLLDQPSNAIASVKVFPLRNTDATAAVDILTNLFEQQTEDELGYQLAGAANASSLVPLRFQPDARSNSVIAFGSAEALTMVQAILIKLDSEARKRQEIVIKLRNAPAADVANAINTFLQSRRDLLQSQPDLVSTYELLDQDVVVTPEPVSNTLIISATPTYYPTIMDIVKKLDSEPPQVAIQALLVEVALDDTDEFGVELGFQDPTLFARSVIDQILTTETTNTLPNGTQTTTTNIISQSSNPGFLFNNGNPLGNNTAVSPGTVASQGLSNFGVGRTNTDLGFGGLVLSASSESVSVLIRALQARRNARVLSRPLILALDNQSATIQVGQQIPIVSGVTTNAVGVANPNVTQQQTGIILTVTPRISPEGQVVMVASAEKSAINAAGVPIFVDTAGNVFESPIIDITSASSTVKVPDGQTVVIGGMITKSDVTINRKVPWLGDIPIVQYLFRYDSHTEQRTELLIFLTPRVIYGDADLELVKQVEAERLHFFEEEAEAIHGPLFSVPPSEFGPGAMGSSVIPPVQVYDVRSQAAPMPAPTPAVMPYAPTTP